MADTSKIEWTDATWNIVTGCDKVSPGCAHCYAETFAERWRGTPGHHFQNGFDIILRPERLGLPLSWKKPRKVFVNSMSDLFHKDIPDEYIAKAFAVMALTPQHTYQVLTKRHGRMRALLTDRCSCGSGHTPGEHFRSAMAWAVSKANPDRVPGLPDDAEKRISQSAWPLPGVWLGVSVEDQKRADLRVPALAQTPATVRFLSCEPLLGPVDVSDWLGTDIDEPGIGWVIAGGESGPGARPMSPDWARSLRDQCAAAQVPYLFKQWGEYRPTGYMAIGARQKGCVLVGDPIDDLGHRWEMRRVGKKAAGRELDGREWNEMPS